jgi:hypothetical protein
MAKDATPSIPSISVELAWTPHRHSGDTCCTTSKHHSSCKGKGPWVSCVGFIEDDGSIRCLCIHVKRVWLGREGGTPAIPSINVKLESKHHDHPGRPCDSSRHHASCKGKGRWVSCIRMLQPDGSYESRCVHIRRIRLGK